MSTVSYDADLASGQLSCTGTILFANSRSTLPTVSCAILFAISRSTSPTVSCVVDLASGHFCTPTALLPMSRSTLPTVSCVADLALDQFSAQIKHCCQFQGFNLLFRVADLAPDSTVVTRSLPLRAFHSVDTECRRCVSTC